MGEHPTSVRYNKKFDADAERSGAGSSPTESGSTGANSGGSGFGALLGGRNNQYGTVSTNDPSGMGGGLHRRGDMEKFDV